jgi:hypothetical protein
MKNAPPWLALLVGLLVGVPAARLAVAPDKPAPAPPAAPATTPPAAPAADSTSCKGTGGAPPPAWCEPARVLSEFFGLPAGEPREKVVAGVAQAARVGGYDLRFLTALVPVPPDPRLDQALEAVQRGFAQSDYLLDRAWLPWAGEAGKREAAPQERPGLLLFRGPRTVDGARRLVLVFLVGETPKAGIQKAAFHDTLDLVADLQGAASDPVVALLGPTYSGSVESLRLALLSWRAREGEHQRRLSLRFRAATGSATASGLEEVFADMGVDFCRTVLPDAELHGRSLGFLRDEMGWDLRRVALLTEVDTAYGRSLLASEASEAGAASHERLVIVPFPSHISELRNAAEQEKAAQEKATKTGDDKAPLPASQKALKLALVDPDRPADLVPAYSPLTVHGNELMLANLLQTISREGIRYVGILATDVKDKLFLAERVRDLAPDALLFTFDDNLLYAHPQYAQTMDGLLVFSSSPLFTEGAPGLPAALSSSGTRERRQFTSELQQGIYEAVRYLLGEAPVVPPRAWITAVGNGSLWPIARLPMPPGPGTARLCRATAPQKPPAKAKAGSRHWQAEGNGFAGKDDLQILLVAILLSVFAWRLRRVALLEPVPGSPLDPTPGNRRLLVMGTVLLAFAAGVLLAVGSVPVWARRLSLRLWLVSWDPTQVLYLVGLGAAYGLLVAAAARSAHRKLTLARGAAWVLGGFVTLAALALGLRWLCMPGGQVELFHLRARAFSSGLSPLVSLAALGGAVYAWVLWELTRRRLMARQSTDCPLESLGDPAISGSETVLGHIRDLLIRTFPKGRWIWLLPAVAFLPPASLLWSTVQPVAETHGYGRFFILFLVLALALAALSFYRFFRLWAATLHILRRLDNAEPEVAEAFQAVAKDLSWRPIQSFGLQLPPFKTPTLSVRRLRALIAAGKVTVPGGPEALEETLREVFAGETDEGSSKEIAARNRLEAIFRQACLDLRQHLADAEARQFLALRVAAWLRYVFAHMRASLLGALICSLLALVAVTAYAFQPRHFVNLALGLPLAGAVGLTLLVFLQMDRNATLSRIGDTTPGKVTFDRTFFSKLFTYVGIPVLGLVATQFPAVGELLGRLASQVLRVAGGG